MPYEAFVKDYGDLKDGAELILTIRDLAPGRRKYNARIVRGRVSRGGPAGGRHVLWIRSMVGRRFAEPWALEILEELGPDAPGRPYSDIYDAMARLRAPAAAGR